MLEFLRGKTSERKLRLFACACCRRIWHIMPDEHCRGAVEVAERYADGIASESELRSATQEVWDSRGDLDPLAAPVHSAAADAAWYTAHPASYPDEVARSAAFAAADAVADAVLLRAGKDPVALFDNPDSLAAYDAEHVAQAGMLRDMHGPLPFRCVAIDPAWLRWNHGTVPAIARRVYDERAFHDLPILADALEDAGCAAADLLAHCRSGGEHGRGCWAVDLILGRS
jgi:hypothetical protein